MPTSMRKALWPGSSPEMTPPILDEQAEALLMRCLRLFSNECPQRLKDDFVQALSYITGCELGQLYLLADGGPDLQLAAEHLVAPLSPRQCAALPSYHSCPLLAFVLRQRTALHLDSLDPALHDTSFLPSAQMPWQSLLCVPLCDRRGKAVGLLLCVSARRLPLGHHSGLLSQLGDLLSSRLAALQVPLLQETPVHYPSCSDDFGLLGDSPAIRDARRMISKVLASDCTVLLTGETGTGKELAARAIHEQGTRRAGAFVVQNCAAFPESLLESELFGYRKGAFTGALRDRPGLFDTAHGGTLLLDEIGDMPLALQAKLLRVLQEGEVRPLGANTTHRIDVRVIASTHRDLLAMAKTGQFREDLYYRLAQFPIELPALRHRTGDAVPLARYFASQASRPGETGVAPLRWSPAVLDFLATHAFPGNVRELKGMVERAVLLCEDGQLSLEHFICRPGALPEREPGLRQRLERFERSLLIESLHSNGGNRTRTARQLGVARRTLQYRLQRLNIQSLPDGGC
ncbi:sigma 54-interacting transcriptional regulator [uncultured Pseudomonas sp.]|uniref:sigma-54-dependent Fis family transcriptional regulator n=1 Tax=uncultured Pseudomonas sp. TaxID=114707 RepID=UPI0025D839A9|nr:sigma 54-interacting transcriptional regulator [uncultured Pseudomonas sp.]